MAKQLIEGVTTSEKPLEKRTLRTDRWWVEPALTFIVLTLFIIYATFRTFENQFYSSTHHLPVLWSEGSVPDLLSPFYSPLFLVDWKIAGITISPAMIILPFPLFFRLSCYYYRKAYYRAFFWTPPACAVRGTAKSHYTGEKEFPWALQNLHRYALYFALVFILILGLDVIKSMSFADGWGLSVGSLVLLANWLLLSGYTLGCHSFRHLSGGCLDCFSCSLGTRARHSLWQKITSLNERHAFFAWTSLFSVALADFYVRLVTSGTIQEFVFFKF